ncbi:Uncharacterized protein SCF082_LOCUS45697 [Durusdinium trenchii]|uniref:Uncharacterized protein n=1 Tax=Durusdinium trenchii TaxID=1381693 RepID=A0ABP0RDN6_9DINO
MKSGSKDALDWDGVPSNPVWDFTTGTSSEWVERAVKANFRAARAAREAEDDLAEASHHEEVAQAAAQKAKTVMLQSQQEAIKNVMRSSSVQPFIRFCSNLAKALGDGKSNATEPAMLQLRKFCQGFFDDLRSMMETPEVHGSRAEQKLYDSPPQEFQRERHWSPITANFHPPPIDLDHRLEVQQAALWLLPLLVTLGRRRSAAFL